MADCLENRQACFIIAVGVWIIAGQLRMGIVLAGCYNKRQTSVSPLLTASVDRFHQILRVPLWQNFFAMWHVRSVAACVTILRCTWNLAESPTSRMPARLVNLG